MNRSRRDWAPLIALGLFSLIWGYNWVATKVALEFSHPFQLAALRALGGGIVLIAVLAAMRKSLKPPAIGWTILLGLTQTTGFFALICLALAGGQAGKASVLTYTMPFWVLILALPFLGERLNRSRTLAGLFGFAGIVLILSPWLTHPDTTSSIYAIAAGLDWAVAVVIAKKIPPLDGMWELLSLNAWQSLIGALPLIVLALLLEGPTIQWTGTFIGLLLYIIVLATSLAWFLWLFVLSRLPASQSGLASLAVPVLGIFAAWLQLGERPALWETAGVLAIVAGLAALAWSSRRPATHQAP
jgi:drug/metabolite transporter (DMT)-like permease